MVKHHHWCQAPRCCPFWSLIVSRPDEKTWSAADTFELLIVLLSIVLTIVAASCRFDYDALVFRAGLLSGHLRASWYQNMLAYSGHGAIGSSVREKRIYHGAFPMQDPTV